MAKFDYEKARLKAAKIIAKFGGPGTFKTPPKNGGLDPKTGDPISQGEILKPGLITPIIKYKGQEIDGDSIIGGDGSIFFEGPKINIGDQVTINGETWRAIGFETLSSIEGIVVFTQIQLRK